MKNQSIPITLIILTVISVLLGICLRLFQLQEHVIWHDEVHTILRAMGATTNEFTDEMFDGKIHSGSELQKYQKLDPQKKFKDTLRALASHPEHSPLYFLFVRSISPFFDSPIIGARFLSALISLFLFPAIFLLTKMLFPQYKTAPFIALCLLSLSPLQILYAREARQYALFEVMVIVATFQFLKACQNDRGWGWYGVTLAVGLYTHLIFCLLIITHGCFLSSIARYRIRWLGLFKSVFIAGICFSPWIWIIISGIMNLQKHTAWMHIPLPLSLIVFGWIRHIHHILFDLPNFTELQWISIPLILICFFYTMLKGNRKTAIILGLSISLNIVPLVIPDLIAGGQRSMETRYFLQALLFLHLCVVFFFAYIVEKSKHLQWLGYSMIVGLLVGTGFFGNCYFNTDTWWNKRTSINNPKTARIINTAPNPLVISKVAANSPGEVLSLSYLVDPKTRFLLLPANQIQTVSLPKSYNIFLFSPSWDLLKELRHEYNLSPIADTKESLWGQTPS